MDTREECFQKALGTMPIASEVIKKLRSEEKQKESEEKQKEEEYRKAQYTNKLLNGDRHAIVTHMRTRLHPGKVNDYIKWLISMIEQEGKVPTIMHNEPLHPCEIFIAEDGLEIYPISGAITSPFPLIIVPENVNVVFPVKGDKGYVRSRPHYICFMKHPHKAGFAIRYDTRTNTYIPYLAVWNNTNPEDLSIPTRNFLKTLWQNLYAHLLRR